MFARRQPLSFFAFVAQLCGANAENPQYLGCTAIAWMVAHPPMVQHLQV